MSHNIVSSQQGFKQFPSQSKPSTAAGSPQPQPKSYKHDPSSNVAPAAASKLHAVASIHPATTISVQTPLTSS